MGFLVLGGIIKGDMLEKLNKYRFLILLTIFIVTFFSRNNVRSVDEIMPEVLRQPYQSVVYSQKEVAFARDGYQYRVLPFYDYEINALVVGKMDYRLFNIYGYDKIFPLDLCLIWGSNVARKLHRNSAVSFSQDCRWCWANWFGDVNFNINELSNNHLLINNKEILQKAKDILKGDQIKIKGKLVNVKANGIGEKGSCGITWNTSVSRIDSGAGACEVIYVENIEILKKANIISRVLFRLSAYGLLLIIIWNVIDFFRGPKSAKDIR